MGKIEITCRPLDKTAIVSALPLLLEQDVKQLQQGAMKGIYAVHGKVAVGVLLYHVYEKYIVMDKVAVLPQYQRFGVGTALLETMGKLAEAFRCQFFFSFTGTGNQEPFYRFVASTGLFYVEKQAGFEAVLKETDLQEICGKYSHTPAEDTYFFDLTGRMQEPFLKQMEQAYPGIADEIRNRNEDYSRKLCCCVVAQGQVQAACFIKDYGTEMELKLLYSLPERGVLAAKALLQSVANLEQQNLVPMRVAPTGDAAVKIIDGLCSSYQVEKRIYTAYYLGKSETRG